MNVENGITYVDDEGGLSELCERLQSVSWFALDTEFQRESTYFPKLCLLQVATPDLIVGVDPLALEEFDCLLSVIYDPRITKVMHAAGQDLEIFFHLRGELPRPVFDTQLAARFLGYPEQVSYAALVAGMLKVNLSKAHTRADWTRRPLSAEQLRYAADDVRYLAQLYPTVRDSLSEKGRLAWLEQDLAALSDKARYESDPSDAWRRLRGAERLRGARLSALQALAAWREQMAKLEDRPRGWLIRDDFLLVIARLLPKTRDELGQVRGLPKRFLSRHGNSVLEVVAEACERPPIVPGSDIRPPLRASREESAVIDALMALVSHRAAEATLNPSMLAGRKELEQLVMGQTELPVLQSWRRNIVGEDLLAFLRGELTLSVDSRRLLVLPREPAAADTKPHPV